MRHFTNVARAKAVDQEFDFLCRVSVQGLQRYDSLRTYSIGCQLLKNGNSKIRRSFWIMKSFEPDIKTENGVKMIVNSLGGPKGCPIPTVLQLKEFLEFTEGDFAFLQYLGSAVVNLEQAFVPYRSHLVASRREVEEAIGTVSAEEYEPGMILLGDSGNQFI